MAKAKREKKNYAISGEVYDLLDLVKHRHDPDAREHFPLPEGYEVNPKVNPDRQAVCQRALDLARHDKDFQLYMSMLQAIPPRQGTRGYGARGLTTWLSPTHRSTVSLLESITRMPRRRRQLCVQEAIVAYLFINHRDHLLAPADFVRIREMEGVEFLLLESPGKTFSWTKVIDRMSGNDDGAAGSEEPAE